MNIRPVLEDEKIIKVENKKEQNKKKISEEIQELIIQNKEPILTISHIQKQIVSKFPS